MKEIRIELGIGLVRKFTNLNNSTRLSIIMQDFGLREDEIADLPIGYEELCEIHHLAKALHESVKMS